MDCENGVVSSLPAGFRFWPTDEELILHYLRRKVCSLPLPAATPISEYDVFSTNPWDLPGDLKEKRYFFSKIDKNVLKLRSGCGYWKATGKEKQVVAHATNYNVIAIRRSFVFYKGKSIKTQWKMHQFRLVICVCAPDNLTQKLMPVGDWVVSCVYKSKKKPRRNYRILTINGKNELGLSSVEDSP